MSTTGGKLINREKKVRVSALTEYNKQTLYGGGAAPSQFGTVDGNAVYVNFFAGDLNSMSNLKETYGRSFMLYKIVKSKIFIKLIQGTRPSCPTNGAQGDNMNDYSVFAKIAPWKNKRPPFQDFTNGQAGSNLRWSPESVNAINGMKFKVLNGADPEIQCTITYPVNEVEVENTGASPTTDGGALKCNWVSTDSPGTAYNGFVVMLDDLGCTTSTSTDNDTTVIIYLEHTILFKRRRAITAQVATTSGLLERFKTMKQADKAILYDSISHLMQTDKDELETSEAEACAAQGLLQLTSGQPWNYCDM